MNNPQLKSDSVTDMELLEKCMCYFSTLRSCLPCFRLKDACSGILVLVHELIKYLDAHCLDDYGNIEK